MSKSLFSPQDYVLHRFEYPEAIFNVIRSFLGSSKDLCVLDLGCGTGLVTESFLKFFPHQTNIHLMDLDPEMLKEAEAQLGSCRGISSFKCAPSEKNPYQEQQFDLILIGSAWHWMDQQNTIREIKRVLKPGGMVFIFEYQFPKCRDNPALNDWIRMKFNAEWKPATQTPRGSLKELTDCWRMHHQFSQNSLCSFVQQRNHTPKELAGVIASQSRYQHYEQSIPIQERTFIRQKLEIELAGLMRGEIGIFDYSYEGYLFKKRV